MMLESSPMRPELDGNHPKLSFSWTYRLRNKHYLLLKVLEAEGNGFKAKLISKIEGAYLLLSHISDFHTAATQTSLF